MAAGTSVENDGRLVDIVLRDGLLWHDNERVLARDCVASIVRWSKRDVYGATLMQYADELSAPDDRTIRFRLKRPFPTLTAALGKTAVNFPAMMPERLAQTDPFAQIPEVIGSGPFRWNAAERVAGSLAVYEKFAGYKPRESGTPDWTAGPKVANFDRVEWHVVPDASIALVALQNGEADWWESPVPDLLPVLRKNPAIWTGVLDPTGLMACIRMNHQLPPFNDPAVRRALLKAVRPEDFMIAIAGDDPSLWHAPTGFFCVGAPMATDAGLDVFHGPRDYDGVKRALAASGYKGDKVVMLVGADLPNIKAEADVCLDLLQKCGMNVDYQTMEFGVAMQRRAKNLPIEAGGWNVMASFWGGLDQFNPVGHVFLRAQGPKAGGVSGWPESAELERLRSEWIDAPDLASQKRIAEAMQLQALRDVPYIPAGQALSASSYRRDLAGVLTGFPLFWNVRRA
jgi:peptide/nickel transport system substrate-binding protein